MGKVLSIFKSRRYNQGGQTEFQPKASQQTKKEFIDFSLPETVVNNAGDNTQQPNIKTNDQSAKLSELNDFNQGGRTCLCLADDGRIVVSASRENAVVVQRTNELSERLHKWSHHERDIIKLSCHESVIASASRDATIVLWKVGEENCLGVLEDHELAVSAVDFDHRSGNYLVSGSRDNCVKFWDLNSVECDNSIEISRNLVTDIKWKADSDVIVQTSEDRIVRVFDSRLQQVALTSALQKQIQTCCDVIGNYVITGSNGFDGKGCQANLWDLRTMNVIEEYIGHTASITSCAFINHNNEDGKVKFATCSLDGAVNVWQDNHSNYNLRGHHLHSNHKLGKGQLTGVQYSCHDDSLVVSSLNNGIHKIKLF